VRLETLSATVMRRRLQAEAGGRLGAERGGEDGIPLRGATGMTDEVAIARLARRLPGFANLLGDEAWHLERLGAA
jgi:hypothetical protein